VQVVARVEVIDQISHGKLTTEYRYHHGYWDGTEREFRGFDLVEQLDTETFADYHASGAHGSETRFEPVLDKHFSPPLLTKTWFHQGPVDEETGDWRELDWSPDYWPGDPQALAHTEAVNTFLRTLTDPRHRRDALRTLRGSTLRTELYALDGTDRQDRPYTVTEQAYGLREESPPEPGDKQRQRIFFPHLLAQRTTQWERGGEPMTQFAFTDDYDAYGQSRRQVSMAVPRHRDYRTAAPAGEPYLGTLTETQYAQRDDAQRYIVDRVSGSKSFEVLNDGSPNVYDLYRQIQVGTVSRKLFGQTFNYYDGEAFVGLSIGQLGDFGALVRTASLVLTEEILSEAYRDPANPTAPTIPPYLRPEGVTSWTTEYPQEFRDRTQALAGYTFADGSDHRTRGYFAHASRVAFDFHRPGSPHRGLPVTMRDPLGNDTTIAYDSPYHLLPMQVTDAVGLTMSAEYDYRILQPRMTTDANANRRAVSFNPLGLVTATAVMGKAGEPVGDTLEKPGSRLEYDFFAFVNRQQPVFVRSIVRQHHVTETDVPLPERDETIETVEFSDGFGRLLQTRTQAEDVLFGDLSFGGGVLSSDQSIVTGDAIGRRRAAGDPPNVIVSGWQVHDNKGRVVEKYEPFFAVGRDYGAPSEAQFGQKATMFYDPRGQVIRTLNPDGSEQRVIFGIPTDLTKPEPFVPMPWEVYTYDANDLAPLSKQPDGAALADAAPATHHFTPSSILIGALGRTVLAVARNRDAPEKPGDPFGPAPPPPRRSRADHGGGNGLQRQCARQIAPRHRRCAHPRGLQPGPGYETVIDTVSKAASTAINLIGQKPLKGRPTIYFLEGPNPLPDFMRRRVVNEPLAAAEKHGYDVKRILDANVRDLRDAVSDPNVVGIVIMAHGEEEGVKGRIILRGSRRPDPWGPVVSDDSDKIVGPEDIDNKKVSPSLKLAVLIVCKAIEKGEEWSDAFDGAEVYGYDYSARALKV
jgi:hypothetical protein